MEGSARWVADSGVFRLQPLVSAYVLVAIVKKRLTIDTSLYTLL